MRCVHSKKFCIGIWHSSSQSSNVCGLADVHRPWRRTCDSGLLIFSIGFQHRLAEMRIAIDTGGTFTDCVYLKDGAPTVLKLPSTPDDPARSVLEAIRQIAAEGDAEIRHGTTIGC